MELEKTKVLLIEENPREASSLREVLREAAGANFAMEFTDRLSKGLTRLGEGGVDLVLLSLSTENGLDAFLRVKEHAGHAPVLVLSNSEEEKVAVEAVRNGAHDYLMKQGIDHRALVQSMRHAVELKKTEEALKEATYRLEAATSRLETLANIDALTEVLNRIGLERALQSEFNRAQRQGWNVVAVMLDCDDFDRINASLGHAVGDVVLKEISGRLRETVRPTDHIAPSGGR